MPFPTVNVLGDLHRQLAFNVPPPATASTYKPTLADRIETGIANFLGKLGDNARSARNTGKRATAFLRDVTPVGAATEADDAKRAFGEGNYLGAAGHGLAALLSALPDVGPAAKGVAHAIIAPLWHGSPHKFEKFALEKIGTGEGAQAYGHGLYFAENPKVAQAYRDDLSYWTPSSTLDEAANKSRWAEIANLELAKAKGTTPYGGAWTPDWERRLSSAKDEASKLGTNPGHMYEVKIDANPEDFLQWETPLEAHPDPVVRNYFGGNRPDPAALRQMGDSDWYRSQASFLENTLRSTPEDMRGRLQSAEFVADLAKRGIPGIRYLDQFSRDAGKGTSNYVVFDPSIIDILSRQ